MSVGFFKTRDHQLQKKAKKAQTSYPTKVVSLFPQNDADAAAKKHALQLQRKEELNDAARYKNSVRALIQRTYTAPTVNLFRAPKPTALFKKDLLKKIAEAPKPPAPAAKKKSLSIY